jgi:hypothetical protein
LDWHNESLPTLSGAGIYVNSEHCWHFFHKRGQSRQARGNATVKKGALVTGRAIIIGAGYFILISPASAGRILFLFLQQLTFELKSLGAKGIGSALW